MSAASPTSSATTLFNKTLNIFNDRLDKAFFLCQVICLGIIDDDQPAFHLLKGFPIANNRFWLDAAKHFLVTCHKQILFRSHTNSGNSHNTAFIHTVEAEPEGICFSLYQ